MDYTQATQYIEEKNRLGSVPGLFNIMELLKRLGNPEKKIKALHIAGTNGKGSIMAYVENVLIGHGLKVGRYISPTIFEYRERFQINKEYIGEEELAELITEVSEAIKDMEQDGLNSPTAFEIETAISFLYYVRNDVDIMLIECGMGGKLDATNVLSDNSIPVIASISRDHMQFLGETIEEITYEKLGICKDNANLVIYPVCEKAKKIIDEYVNEHGIHLSMVNEAEIANVNNNVNSNTFTYKNLSYEISLNGDYQILNACTAIEVLEAFNRRWGDELGVISYDEIFTGLKLTTWPGRFSVLAEYPDGKPFIVCDGAHNEDAWLRLSCNINNYFTNDRIVYIIGVLRDKEVSRMLDLLMPRMDYAYTITSTSYRALDGKTLSEMINERGGQSEFVADYKEAVEMAVRKAKSYKDKKENGIVLISGSLSFIGEMIGIVNEMKDDL